MLFQHRTLHWDSPMPPNPLRQHHESPRRGDNVGAIHRARGGALDLNITTFLFGRYAMHWPYPGPNGYMFVADPHGKIRLHTGERARRMRLNEHRKHGEHWGAAGLHSWRRRNGERPITEDEAIHECTKVGTLAIREEKTPIVGQDPKFAAQAHAVSVKYNHPGWHKTLPNMAGAQGKVALLRHAGEQCVLIYGNSVHGRLRRLAQTRRIAGRWSVQPNGTW